NRSNDGTWAELPRSPLRPRRPRWRRRDPSSGRISHYGDIACTLARGALPRVSGLNGRGTSVAPEVGVQPEADGPHDRPPQQVIIYRFSVNRGLNVGPVSEPPDWYAGLLQAALARVRIEGLN